MDIYIVKDTTESIKLCKWLKTIVVNPEFTTKDLLKRGFTNYNKEYLYINYNLGNSVTFNITINIDDLTIKSFDVLDDLILQPCTVNAERIKKIKFIINQLIDKNIFQEGIK